MPGACGLDSNRVIPSSEAETVWHFYGEQGTVARRTPTNAVLVTAARVRIEMNMKGHGGVAARDRSR